MAVRTPSPTVRDSVLLRLKVALPERFSAAAGRFVCLSVGDALRLQIDVPRQVRAWVAKCSEVELRAIADESVLLLEALRDPSGGPEGHDALQAAVVERDKAESILLALDRECIQRDLAFGEVSERLSEAAERVDRILSGVIDQERVRSLIGERLPLLKERNWTLALPEAPHRTTSEQPANWLFDGSELPDELAPSDEEVTRYLLRGHGRRSIEGFAARNQAFAELLETRIAIAGSMEEVLGLLPRLWLGKRNKPTTTRPPWLEDIAAAAAGVEHGPRVIELGLLAVGEAVGQLVVRPRELELRVYADPGALQSVALEGIRAEFDGECWSAKVSSVPTWVHLVITSNDGAVLDETFEL